MVSDPARVRRGHEALSSSAGALIVDLHFRSTNGVGNRLRLVLNSLPWRNLFLDAQLFGDDGFFPVLFRLDHAIFEDSVTDRNGTIHRTALDLNLLVAEIPLRAAR